MIRVNQLRLSSDGRLLRRPASLNLIVRRQ
jgi:hypothetical protein